MAWELIYWFPRDAKGYLLAIKYYLEENSFEAAFSVLEQGTAAAGDAVAKPGRSMYMKHTSKNNIQRSTERRNDSNKLSLVSSDYETATKDPIIALPSDIITDIFLRIPYGERLILRRVSKSWNSELLSNRILWQHIDFRSGKRPVRLADAERSIALADGAIQELYLEKILRPEESLCVDAFLEAAEQNPGALRRLELNCYAPHFLTKDPDGPSIMGGEARMNTLLNLTSLKMALDQSEYFVNDILDRVTLPNLQDLFFYADQHRHVETRNLRYIVRARTSISEQPLPNLKKFRIGSQLEIGSFVERSDFPRNHYFNPLREMVTIAPGSLNDLIALMPNLESLEIKRLFMEGVLDLSSYLRLRYVNLSQCVLHETPLIPEGCKTLILNSLLVGFLEELDFLIENARSIEKLDFSGQEDRVSMSIVEQFSLLSPEVFTDLSLRLVWRDFEPDTVLSHSVPFPGSDLTPMIRGGTPFDYMIHYLPNIKRLDLSCTAVTDQTMRKISGLQRLEYLDVSGTKISLKGVFDLLKPEVSGSMVNDSQTWRSMREHWRATTNVKTIILKKCPRIDRTSIAWLEEHGITTGSKLSDYPEWAHLKLWKPECL
ncbi:hypothetical protein BZA70DRAFT_58197 [Myxozyma melibiosi]|uniref:F-box domain-containing protein n=1 Tax=Myxozyma melibiosi TaxID=54550 RepID=A0ABR1F3S4_9ASCO